MYENIPYNLKNNNIILIILVIILCVIIFAIIKVYIIKKIIIGGSKNYVSQQITKKMNGIEYVCSTASKILKSQGKDKMRPNKQLRDMHEKRFVIDENGKKRDFHSNISTLEGYFLYRLIKTNNLKNKPSPYKKLLEIGMAYGTSALYMIQGLVDSNVDGHLTSIDPFQKSDWGNVGVIQVKEAGLSKYHTLIEEMSDITMADMVKRSEKFDLILIDGNHLFDYTLVDAFFAVKLLRIGGILCIDDINRNNTGGANKYVLTNYPMLKNIPDGLAYYRMSTYIKISEDTRDPDFFHVPFKA